MRMLAALVLALIAGVHYGSDLLALQYVDHHAARRVIYYVLRSFEGAAQYALIAVLAVLMLPRPARWHSSALISAVCGWGVFEHLQAGVCRLSIGIANKPPQPAPMAGICDGLTGLPMYAIGLGMIAFLAAVIAAHSLGDKENG